MHRQPIRAASLLLAGWFCLAGCAGRMPTTKFTNPRFDFSFIERVAVLPFENLSADRQAAWRATRLMSTEMLASGIDLSFSPVLDLDRGSCVIGDRAFSRHPEALRIFQLSAMVTRVGIAPR